MPAQAHCCPEKSFQIVGRELVGSDHYFVIPAKAGTTAAPPLIKSCDAGNTKPGNHFSDRTACGPLGAAWVPACAGMTRCEASGLTGCDCTLSFPGQHCACAGLMEVFLDQCASSTGTVIDSSTVRLAPPSMSSRARLWP